MNEISDFQVSPDGNIYWVYKTDYAALLYPVIGCGVIFFFMGNPLQVNDLPATLIVGKSILELKNNSIGSKDDLKINSAIFKFDTLSN